MVPGLLRTILSSFQLVSFIKLLKYIYSSFICCGVKFFLETICLCRKKEKGWKRARKRWPSIRQLWISLFRSLVQFFIGLGKKLLSGIGQFRKLGRDRSFRWLRNDFVMTEKAVWTDKSAGSTIQVVKTDFWFLPSIMGTWFEFFKI